MRSSVSDYFLGANSQNGFFSLYEELKKAPSCFLYAIKGGPGSGKSTFLKKIAHASEMLGAEVERIHCSSDPQSLDGVIIRDLRLIYVDGTSPHVTEPVLPGLQGAYLSLLPEKRLENLHILRRELQSYHTLYQAEYKKAYACLGALGKLDMSFPVSDTLRQAVRTQARRQIQPDGLKGSCRELFLSSLCHEGVLPVFPDTAFPCSAMITVAGNTAPIFMEECLQIARENSLSCTVCRNWQKPEQIDHILFCGGTGYIRQELAEKAGFKPSGSLSLPDGEENEAAKPLRQALLSEAIEHLKKAKEYHDRLEESYRPFLDFSCCDKKARAHIQEITRLLGRKE